MDATISIPCWNLLNGSTVSFQSSIISTNPIFNDGDGINHRSWGHRYHSYPKCLGWTVLTNQTIAEFLRLSTTCPQLRQAAGTEFLATISFFSPSRSAIPVAWYLYFGGVFFAFDLWRKSGGNKTLVTFMLIGFDGGNKMLQSFILMTLGNCPPGI